MPNDCVAWQVQKHLIKECAPFVTQFTRCSSKADKDVVNLMEPRFADGKLLPLEACGAEHTEMVRCAAKALQEPGYDKCLKTFEAVSGASTASPAQVAKAWTCALRYYNQSLEQMAT
ncbi:unnamed protein product [Polarella glacialis]|uniref:Uncharacterized protein n=1 Tax=Polarella glacialis TaxID=89957 RepID=A0A813KX25_POLGL|nr:unnamed protein product [Polarella glacialis]